MRRKDALSRRHFVGGVATALGTLTLAPDLSLFAQQVTGARPQPSRPAPGGDDYDSFAKLSFNENPYGPSKSVIDAITKAFKYANRYGYPDGDIVGEIARLHGVERKNVLLTAGSSDILDVVGTTFASNGKKVIGVEPSYGSVYSHVTSIKGDALTIGLRPDFGQDVGQLARLAHTHYREAGFVYLCNPNNPTGVIVTKAEIRQLLDGLPEDMPVLIDEAYYHFVDDPNYGTSVPYVLEGRPVIVTRTFSKIAALAGVRLGYAIAPADLVEQMRPYTSSMAISALAKWAGVAALKDTETQAWVKKTTIALRNKTTSALDAMGYKTIPSQTNFFMVHLGRPIGPVSQEFQKKGVLVGRPFPPMTEHLRVSIGTADEMDRFMVAFKEIMGGQRAAGGKS